MSAVGTRNTNSPRELVRLCCFLIFPGDEPGEGLGVRVTVTLGSAKPGSRKTVPETKAYDSDSAVFLPACTSGRMPISRSRRLMPILFLLFLFFLVFLLVIIEIFFLFFFLFLILRGFELKRIETGHGEIGAAFLAGQRVAFINFVLVYVDHSVAVWTVDHLLSLQKHIPLYKNLTRTAQALALA